MEPDFRKHSKGPTEGEDRPPKQKADRAATGQLGEHGQLQEKVDSVLIAREIVLGKEGKIGRWLLEFRKIKTPAYDKFTARICSNLEGGKLSFGGSMSRFMAISDSATADNTTAHQLGCILTAFHSFWKQCHIQVDSMLELLNFVQPLYPSLGKQYVQICGQLIATHFKQQGHEFQKEGLCIVNKLMKASSREECKILALIHYFNLYGDIPFGRIVDLLLHYNHIAEIAYMFQSQVGQVRFNLLKLFIDRCVNYGDKAHLTKCEVVIKALRLDPFQFGSLIGKMQERYINYLVRTYKLFFIELIICHDRALLLLLVEELKRQRRQREMQHLAVKYEFNHLQMHLGQEHREDLLRIRNVLLHQDQFGPTEVDVLQEQEADRFLRMQDFGITEKDVVLVDSNNITQIDPEIEFPHKVGIDEERGGGTHVFDPSNTSIIQIFNGKRVFIFDVQQLGHNPQLKQIMTHILMKCQIYGQEIGKEMSELQRNMELGLSEKEIEEMRKGRVTECSRLFKQVFPKQKKSSLAFQCDFLLGKTLSKYEQCSGWIHRPLRKAQLHYAALDSVLPYKICEQLSNIGKRKPIQ